MSADDMPMMPFFVRDWMASTCHWASAERGAYISLLAFQWCNGTVPADVSELARIAGLTEAEFEKVWLKIGHKFDGDTTGLFNNRLEDHRKESLRLRDARALGAQVANEKRRAKRDSRRNAEQVAERDAERDAQTTHPSRSISTSSEEESKNSASLRSANAQRDPRETRGGYWKDEKWIDFKLGYPDRAGGYDWPGAEKQCRARLREGCTWEQIFDGRDRYRTYCEAAQKIGSEYVMMPRTFLGKSKRFLDDWDIPDGGVGSDEWTPPSDDPLEAA